MGNKIFGAVVFLLWASSMSWLLTTRILPSYFHGEVPNSGLHKGRQAIGWTIDLGGEECGFAVTQAVDGAGKVTEVHSRVVLKHVSLDKVAPRWMIALVKDFGDIRMEMRNKSTLDSFKNLATIESLISLNDMPSVVRVNGRVSDGKLRLRLRSGDLDRSLEYPWKEGDLMGELSPESKMIQVYVGRTWRTESYSPFGSPHNPVEMVEARVVEEEDIFHAGRLVTAKRIEYRTVSSAGVSSRNRLKSEVWVADDCRVLRQDVYFLHTRLRFQRLSDEESTRLAEEHLELDTYATTRTPTLDVPDAQLESTAH